ncbi:hypothetical protein [Desulforhabdus amnigena]|jgi:hypothetical protein|nr:hypothetical protein [Desulforhabdus amnigena]
MQKASARRKQELPCPKSSRWARRGELMQAHDHNFKNVFLDFPKEALSWLLPEALQAYGQLERIEFVRQEVGGADVV